VEEEEQEQEQEQEQEAGGRSSGTYEGSPSGGRGRENTLMMVLHPVCSKVFNVCVCV